MMRSNGARYSSCSASLWDPDVDGHPVSLGVVADEVLDAGADAVPLQPVDVRGADPRAEQRVLGVALEVPAAQWAAMQVDGGREQHVDALAVALGGQEGGDPLHQRGVPAGCERGR